MSAVDSFVAWVKDLLRPVLDAIVRVLAPVARVARKIPGVDKFLGSIAVNGPRYGALAAAFVAKFVGDTWDVDLGSLDVFGWTINGTAVLAALLAFSIGYLVQKVLTLPRVNPAAFAPVEGRTAPPVDFDAPIEKTEEFSDESDPYVPPDWIELSEAVEALEAGFPPEEDQD